jgi:hypothetical protein
VKTLYVNGDSHSSGHEAGGPNYAYGKHIAQALGYDYVCDAVPGCSNNSIIQRTQEYLKSNTPDFLIIGWSTWERETWYWDDQSYNITASGHDKVHPALQDRYKQWVIEQSVPEQQWHKEFTAHDDIWNFHNSIKHIPHLFFNCFSHFFYTVRQNKIQYNWGNNYIDPYNQNFTYYYWLDKTGYKPVNPKFYHYGADAHKAWADFILPKVKTILTTNE